MMQVMTEQAQIYKKYFRRAKFMSYLLHLVPYVQMVGLTGSLSRGDVKETSDIDFFVVLKKDRLWLGRILVSLIVQLTGLRRHGQKIAGRICLNRYQTEDRLIVSPKTVANAEHFSWFVPFWWKGNLWVEFINANQWIKEYGFYFKNKKPDKNILVTFLEPLLFVLQFIITIPVEVILGGWGETLARNYQVRRIKNDTRIKSLPPGAIYFSDQELRFHPPKIN